MPPEEIHVRMSHAQELWPLPSIRSPGGHGRAGAPIERGVLKRRRRQEPSPALGVHPSPRWVAAVVVKGSVLRGR